MLPAAGLTLLNAPVAYRDAVIRAAAASFMAGGEAERTLWMMNGRGTPLAEPVEEIIQRVSKDDREDMCRLLTECLGVPPREVARIEDQGRKDAAELVCRPDVYWIAEELLYAEDGMLLGSEVEEIVPHPHPMSAARVGALRITIELNMCGLPVDFERLCEALKSPVVFDRQYSSACLEDTFPPTEGANAASQAQQGE